MSTRLVQIAPAFAVRDLDAMVDFYRRLLGFEARYKTDVYAVLAGDDVQLHLYPARDGFNPGQSSAYIFVQGVDAIYAKASELAKIVHPIADQSYGLRDFLMEDPEGNRVGIAQRLETA
jgi:catechol 2,3-dioxygenase-like lactoylglutathione lyase family enzyme